MKKSAVRRWIHEYRGEHSRNMSAHPSSRRSSRRSSRSRRQSADIDDVLPAADNVVPFDEAHDGVENGEVRDALAAKVATQLLETIMSELRHDQLSRRNAIIACVEVSALGGGGDAGRTEAEVAESTGEINALAKAAVGRMVAKLKIPFRLSRARVVARVSLILSIAYADLGTDVGMLSQV